MRVTIEPLNEPRGEGCGWDDCAAEDATIFAVFLGDEMIETFQTMDAARAFVQHIHENGS